MNELNILFENAMFKQRSKIGKMADLKNKWAKLNSSD